ncbi:hypothetical protein ALC62_04089 [Cyphomyrmex costatus]|uniref:DUF4218 domain-containing protein n=1 Tax=Cyphomyrmex costatus TaxID=456900 RepID=A0A151IKN0_9HYME|nr:hypothetical protein ALC62_04089 [Cyphomyrmex costatus]
MIQSSTFGKQTNINCYSYSENISSSDRKTLEEIFISALAQWAITENINLSSMGKLLEVLRLLPSLKNNLPKDPRTLLKTPRSLCVKQLSSGLYYYFGIESTLNKLVIKHRINIHTNQDVDLAVNIDGLPISKSTNSVFWPILCSIKSMPLLKGKVFLVALFHSHQKPDPHEFLSDFINECIQLSISGIKLDSIYYNFKVSMLICDTPAKSLVLATKGHSGYYSCPKCTIAGDMYNNVICFIETDCTKRTDTSFRNKEQPEHHVGSSSLLNLPNFDTINNVPVDYMHALLLGACKRLLCHNRYGWIFGKPPHKLRARNVEKISQQLSRLKTYVPCEFSRKTRPIEECKRYKATEFRFFLLYSGPLVLKKILPASIYHNFLTLSVASLILISPRHASSETSISYAQELLKCFIRYGPDFISHSVHCLIHLSDCVRLFGPLDNSSAFEFENYLQTLKRLIRKHDQPLQQIIRRIYEEQHLFEPKSIVQCSTNSMQLLMPHHQGPLINECTFPQYKKIKTTDYCINIVKKADRFVEMNDGTIVEVHNIACYKNSTVLLGYTYRELGEFF